MHPLGEHVACAFGILACLLAHVDGILTGEGFGQLCQEVAGATPRAQEPSKENQVILLKLIHEAETLMPRLLCDCDNNNCKKSFEVWGKDKKKHPCSESVARVHLLL